jgi:hypothetical protein
MIDYAQLSNQELAKAVFWVQKNLTNFHLLAGVR